MNKKFIKLVTATLSIAIIAVVVCVNVVKANPIFFSTPISTATATTSPTWITAGTATTTLTYDSFLPNGSATTGAYQAALLYQLVATSTLPAMNINFEFSDDGIDWYQNGGTATFTFATSSKPYDLSQVLQFRHNFASSTAGLGAITPTSATTTRIVVFPTPLRFSRAIFTVPTGSGQVAVWARIVPIKERAE